MLDNNFDLVKKHLSEFLIKTLGEHVIEDGAEIEEIHDSFGPVSTSSKSFEYFKMPNSCNFYVIDQEEDAGKVGLLVDSAKDDEPIGIDCEWRPSMNVFHKAQGPSIIQICDSKNIFIIDLLKMKNSVLLANILQKLFEDRIVVGFGF